MRVPKVPLEKVPLEKVPMSQRKYILIVSGACIVTRLICTVIAKKYGIPLLPELPMKPFK